MSGQQPGRTSDTPGRPSTQGVSGVSGVLGTSEVGTGVASLHAREDTVDLPDVSVPLPGSHGGDGAVVARALGRHDLLDLSLSMNPCASDVVALVRLFAHTLNDYPDPTAATERVAAALDVPRESVLLTNGGAEAIDLVAQFVAQSRTGAVVEEPEFSLYRRALAARGVPVRSLATARPGDMVFRSDPRNPTGERALASRPQGTRLCVDTAFLPLVTGSWQSPALTVACTSGESIQREGAGEGDRPRAPKPDASGPVGPSMVQPVGKVDGRDWAVGSFTKVFGCPGLRIGYVAGDVDCLRAFQPRWSVNALALAVLPSLLDLASEELPRWAGEITRLRERLLALLAGAGWCSLSGALANYVCIETSDAVGLRAALAQEGVLVRAWPPWIRVAVRDESEQDRFIEALAKVRAAGIF